MRGQASDLGSNWFLTRNLNFTRDYLEAVQKVTLDDIRRVTQKYLTNDNLTIVSLNPKGSLAARAESGESDLGREKFKSLSSRTDCVFSFEKMRACRSFR